MDSAYDKKTTAILCLIWYTFDICLKKVFDNFGRTVLMADWQTNFNNGFGRQFLVGQGM